MATETSFEALLDDGISIRMRFSRERGQITHFVVQLEMLVDDEWQPVVRYDTAHSFAHRDILHPDGTQEKQAVGSASFSEAMTLAQRDIKENYRAYCEQYERWFDE